MVAIDCEAGPGLLITKQAEARGLAAAPSWAEAGLT